MIQYLLTHIIQDYTPGKSMASATRNAIGRTAGRIGILLNLLLSAGKVIAGLLSGTISLIADGLNNATDAASSVVTLAGFRLARRPADSDHPYGHARYEYVSGLFAAALILVIGLESAKSSISAILHPLEPEITLLTILIPVFSLLMKIWMAIFYRRLGHLIHSGTLLAASADSRNDAIATAGVLVGIGVQALFHWNIDGYIGLAVAGCILLSGISVIRDTISPLLGMRGDEDTAAALSELVLSHEGILGIHDLLLHDYGPGECHATLHCEMSASIDPLICHDIIDDIECDALEKLNIHLVIHYDPVLIDDAEWQTMYRAVCVIAAKMDPRYSVHDFRLVKGASHTRLTFDLAVPYEDEREYASIKNTFDTALKKRGNYISVIRLDHTP